MTALYAFDGADPKFDLSAAKRAGAIAISVYIVGTPGGMPHADAARVAAIRAEGLGALPNWERAADFFSTCTIAEARGAGEEALVACKQLGFPADGSIQVAFSFDFDCPTSRFPEMGQKMDAVQAGLTGAFVEMAYAQENLIDYAVAHSHLNGKQWLMASTWGQPYTPSDRNVCMVQGHDVNGNWIKDPVNGTDINTVTDPFGLQAWWPDNSPYGGNMSITDADIFNFWNGDSSRITLDDGKTTWTASHVLKRAYTEALAAHGSADAANAKLVDLQKAVAALQDAVSKIQPGNVTADPDAIAAAVTAAIVAHVGIKLDPA